MLLIPLAIFFLFHKAAIAKEDGTFKNPSMATRPRFRYWLPDASVNATVVANDIEAAGSVGAGGVEFIPFYNYGGEAPTGADWATYGFGTPMYRDIFVKALETHADNGMVMDFPLGPNQGQGVSARWDDEGLQWDLVSFTASVPTNGVFKGIIPGWGHGDLVAVTSALVQSETNQSETTTDFDGQTTHNWLKFTLAHDTLREHTSDITLATGQVKLNFPRARGNAYYRLFVFYQKLSHHRNLQFEPTGNSSSSINTSIFSNGSFVVDHHSARGAQTMIDFWETHLLDDKVRDLIRRVGNYAWEDSIEILSNITWTPSLPQLFKKKHGYSINPVLPLLNFRQNSKYAQFTALGSFEAVLDSPCHGVGYINDYRSALEDGYNAYLDTLRAWVHKLGIKYSNQPGYGLPQDMTAGISHVDVPEYESLAFQNSIDGYRQFIGMAHLSGKKVISNELGAAVFRAYSYTIPDLLDTVHRAIIGGTNGIILHGQPFSGSWFGTTWPGYTPFKYLFAEMYSPKQPAWEHGFSNVLEYIARLQFVQRQGTPRTDVAIFNRVSRTNTSFPSIYADSDLEQAGYSYSYISSLGFDLQQAYVQHKVLAPDGPAWKVLVVPSQQGLTAGDVRYLKRYARQGLPIILAGGQPQYRASGDKCSERTFGTALKELTRRRNVYMVRNGEVAAQLSKLNLSPRAWVNAPGVVYTTWREDPTNGLSYAFLYNQGNSPVQGTATFATKGVPYSLDAWTGKKLKILTYTQGRQGISVPVRLAAGQTMVLTFDARRTPASCHFTSLSSHVLGVTQSETSTLSAKLPAHNLTALATFANGSTVQLKADTPEQPPIHLKGWNLTVEHWEAPADMYDAETIAIKRNMTYRLESPTSWLNITELRNASGIGYYTTEFTWPPPASERRSLHKSGAYLQFSNITHTLRAFVNDNPVEAFDHSGGMTEISGLLVPGRNTLRVVVPTTMWNYLSSIASKIRESGQVPDGILYAERAPQLLPKMENGLAGGVTLLPYATVQVAC
ncbi:hypothetical protein BJY00DRAFT_320442 [Aspergillus carlsbadensis]|nr:hypothetical protein BJY00DRAFT_320442 [Aspergillus carlsbadensis]